MRIVSNNFFKTTLLAFLPCLFLTFSGCSQLDTDSKGTVSFRLNTTRAAREIARDIVSPDQATYIDVELQGGYTDSQTQELEADKDIYITFENVPVGREINVYAQIYTLIEGEKQIIYAGTSETKTIQREENLFQFMLDFAYDSYVETSSAYIVLRPLFSVERDGRKLETNKIEFKYDEDDTKCDESFSWQRAKLSNYQKARVTFRGKDLSQDNASYLRFRLVKYATGARYPIETKSVSASAQTYEFEIPQYINLDEIAVENSWDASTASWAPDFTCYIDKIELIKDSSLIDPDFNKITKTTSSYVVQNPPVQNILNTNISKNTIEFDSKNDNGPYSAAYWECEDIEQYDKVSITVKCTQQNATGMRFLVKGYSPFKYPEKDTCESSEEIITSTNPYTNKNQITIPNLNESYSFTMDIADLKKGPDDSTISIQAIEFENASFTGDYAVENFGDVWTIVVEEIKLYNSFSMNISVPGSEDITVTTAESTSSYTFTAPADYTSYVWKVDGNVQEETGNVFVLDMTNLDYGIHDITLLADDENRHHSWTAQVEKSQN